MASDGFSILIRDSDKLFIQDAPQDIVELIEKIIKENWARKLFLFLILCTLTEWGKRV